MTTTQSDLERMLFDEGAEPKALPLSLLEEITNGFSSEMEIGRGGFAVVYKGMLNNGAVAVKRLTNVYTYEKDFNREVECLIKAKHKKIVRFLGYCVDAQGTMESYEGKFVMAHTIQRLLCFEYLPEGSLDRHIEDSSRGLEWRQRYKIIKGICEGLNYLHQNKILHLDLKPTNILMDRDMMPKIIDFGHSRCLEEQQTRVITATIRGTMGYMAPEFGRREITYKFDLYSLGVIIMQILTGKRGYQVVDYILESWIDRSDILERKQIRVCAEIAIECTDYNPAKRPVDVKHIIDRLLQTESTPVIPATGSSDQKAKKKGNVEPVQAFYTPRKETMASSKLAKTSVVSAVPKEHRASIRENDLECMLNDDDAMPKALPLSLLKQITKGFSDELVIGRGGFAVVYKAMLQNRAIIVKRLSNAYMYEKQFLREVECLVKVKHKNIVRFLGYCSDTQGYVGSNNGKFVMADLQERLLCFEYLPNGSLDHYINDSSKGLEWTMRYKLIKGICEGLNYLHENNIVHFDLKPANILMSEYMLPKITNFSYSRCLEDKQPLTTTMARTFGYLPPEFFSGIITHKFDLYSLGLIIVEMLTGEKGCQPVANVIESWSNRLEKSQRNMQLEQIRVCAEIGMECIEYDPAKRPESMEHIINRLLKTESSTRMGSKPHHFTLQLLKTITNNFCDEQIIGKGGYGVVYKGVLENGQVVAVKRLMEAMPNSQKQFENEVNLLMKLEHPNIVRLVGYCYETQHLHLPYEGKFIFASNIESLLCLEWLPNGSLDRYISDAYSGLEWRTRWKIIEGISFGLQYLHEQPNGPIIHLDLKPANILLNENMLPKIADFGLSRLFDQKPTTLTAVTSGTLGYMSPEYLSRGIITPMSDIFSLGVIIMEIITGHRDYPYDITKFSKDFIELELQKWRNLLREKQAHTSLDIDCQQIKRCIQIGLICVNPERTKRPTMKKIINLLQGLESTSW